MYIESILPITMLIHQGKSNPMCSHSKALSTKPTGLYPPRSRSENGGSDNVLITFTVSVGMGTVGGSGIEIDS